MPAKMEAFEESLEQHRGLLEDMDTEEQSYRHKNKTLWYRIGKGIVYVILFAVYSLGLYHIATRRALAMDSELDIPVPGPLREAIQYEVIPLVPDNLDNAFAGDPRPEHDKAWSDILENMHIRFSSEEMKQVNKTSLEFKDGGSMVQLGAYHELHCVKWIRKWIHRDHYWPFLQGAMLGERKTHIEHCLELMRLNAMCRGSTDVTTFTWVGSQPRPISTTQHKCVNWEAFDAWNHERRVDLSDLSIFKDRPEPKDWELFDQDVRMGSKKGDTAGFEQLITGKISE